MRSPVERLRTLLIDLRFGGTLRGLGTPTRFAHLGAFDTVNSTYADLRMLFAQAGLHPDDVFVDVGCGKGRVLNWVLLRERRARVVGIELDPDLCARAASRLRRFKNVSVLCGDATVLLPPDATVLYLYNPFNREVTARFVATIKRRTTDVTRVRQRIIYQNAAFLDLFDEDPDFVVERLSTPDGFASAIIRWAG